MPILLIEQLLLPSVPVRYSELSAGGCVLFEVHRKLDNCDCVCVCVCNVYVALKLELCSHGKCQEAANLLFLEHWISQSAPSTGLF